MRLYHGGTTIINKPKLVIPTRTYDFGNGFYMTQSEKQAKKYANIKMSQLNENSQFVNVFNFDMFRAEREFSVLKLYEPNEVWLDFVCQNRYGLINDTYDVVIGCKIYSIISKYEKNILNKQQTMAAIKSAPLYEQIVIKNESALALLTFCNAYDPRQISAICYDN